MLQRVGALGTLALALALAAAALGAHAASATAAQAALRADPSLVRVLGPQQDSTVRGGSVTIRVRVKSSVRSFSAELGGRSIARRFMRRPGGARVARLRVGRTTGLRYGMNRLRVWVAGGRRAGDYESVRFALVRRSAGLLRVAVRRHCSRRAMVHLRLSSRRAVLSLRLNGRRVPASGRPGRRLRTIGLDADEGLHHGRNVLRVAAVDRVGGRFAVRRRAVVIARTAPIPGAGHSRRVLTRRAVKLDARHTRAAFMPPSLRYRWRMVGKPRGSHASLRGATTPRPQLTPDLPGSYRLRMTAIEPAGGRARARASQAAPMVASDTTTVTAAPDDNGIGAAVNTMEGRAVTVADQRYAPPDPTKSLQLVVLDNTNLGLVSNDSFAGDVAGTQALATAVSGLGTDTIAIIAGRALANGRAPIANQDALNNLNRAVGTIGGRQIPASAALSAASCVEPTPVCGGFSAIGTPGLSAGEGTINPGLGARNDGLGVGGALTGYLQPNYPRPPHIDPTTGQQTGGLSHTVYTFVQGDHIAFDTTAPGTTSRQAAIRVGDTSGNPDTPYPPTTYTSQLLPGEAGAYVLVLDAGTLALRDQGTFVLRDPDADKVVTGEVEMAAMLDKYAGDPSALVFVQSIGGLARQDGIGNPNRGDLPYWWNQIGAALQELGVSKLIFNALSSEGSYAQVAPGGPSAASWAKVASQAATSTPGRLSGTLARNDSGQFYAANATGGDDFADGLTQVAYQAPTPWPLRDTPEHVAAIKCVVKNLNDISSAVTYPIEDNYAGNSVDIDKELTYLTSDDDLGYAALQSGFDQTSGVTCDKSAFQQTDYDPVRKQLESEFGDVASVRLLISNLERPFFVEGSNAELRLQSIAGSIQRQQLPQASGPVTYDGLGIAAEVFRAIGALSTFTGQEEVPVGMELIASALGLVDESTVDADGAPELAPNLTAQDATNLADELSDQYVDAIGRFDQIGDMLVGDWGKLQQATTNTAKGGPWDMGSQQAQGDAENAMARAASRFTYTALFPKVYGGLLRGTRGDTTLPNPPDPSAYTCYDFPEYGGDPFPFKPFGGAQQFGGASPIIAAGGGPNGVTVYWVFSAPPPQLDSGGFIWAIAHYPHKAFEVTLPPRDLLQAMFAPQTNAPPLLGTTLQFALSIYDQLQPLNIWHYKNHGAIYNQCQGNYDRWAPDSGS